jgi:hypothetical protein
MYHKLECGRNRPRRMTLSCAMVLGAVLFAAFGPPPLEAGVVNKVVQSAAKKTAPKTAVVSARKSRDALAHRKMPVVRLPEERVVVRYVRTWEEAVRIQRAGFPPNTHMAYALPPARQVSPDRIQRGDWGLSPSEAKQVFGLDYEPQAAIVIRLPKGYRGKVGNVTDGAPGSKEIFSVDAIPPSAITAIRPVGQPVTLH